MYEEYMDYIIYVLIGIVLITMYLRFRRKKNKTEGFSDSHEDEDDNIFNYVVESKVIPGIQKASDVYDYPTANLAKKVDIPDGMYFATSNFGDCVCFCKDSKLECHVKGLNDNLYGKTMKVSEFERKSTEFHKVFIHHKNKTKTQVNKV